MIKYIYLLYSKILYNRVCTVNTTFKVDRILNYRKITVDKIFTVDRVLDE